MVLKELDDELAEFLVARLLCHQQVPGGIHVRSVFTIGFPFTDSIQTERNGRCDYGVLDQELRILHRDGGRGVDIVFQIANRLMEVIVFALFQFRLWI